MHESVHISRDPALRLPLFPPPTPPQTLRATTATTHCPLTKFHRVVIARFYCTRAEQNVAPSNWRYETDRLGRDSREE